MKARLAPAVEAGREPDGWPGPGPYGVFRLRPPGGLELLVIASDGRDWSRCGLAGEPWEHVSVSLPARGRTPTWAELEWVRKQFFRHDETVMQLHVPAAEHVDVHAHCLHLWRPTVTPVPRPPRECV